MGVALALPADLGNLRQALQTGVLKSQRMLGKALMILLDYASCPAPGDWGPPAESGLLLVTAIVNNPREVPTGDEVKDGVPDRS